MATVETSISETPAAGGRKKALVTGASARIGLAIAQRLARAGYDVVLHASPRSFSRAEGEAAALVSAGLRARAIEADLTDPVACDALVSAAEVDGPMQLLVNNAAIFEADTAGSPDLALLERHHAINLRAPIILSAAFHAARRAGPDACIVNMIDQRVLRPGPAFFSYTLAKAALWTATQSMAQAFADKGVRVNAVGPGPVLPNAHDGQEGFAREVASVPLRRAVTVEEIAAAVLYLAEAPSVTGQFIAVDAGQHMGRIH